MNVGGLDFDHDKICIDQYFAKKLCLWVTAL